MINILSRYVMVYILALYFMVNFLLYYNKYLVKLYITTINIESLILIHIFVYKKTKFIFVLMKLIQKHTSVQKTGMEQNCHKVY